MKNYKICAIVLLTLFAFSCSDLEEEPIDSLSPNGFIKTAADVELTINGAIGQIASEFYWGRKYSLTVMLMGDMMDIANTGTAARRIEINSFDSDSNNGMTSVFWPESYKIIGTLNTAIEGAEVVEDEQTKNELIGQAKFLRAWVYFNLVRLFSDIPYIDHTVSDPLALTTISKTSEADVYAGIISDLNFAKDNLRMQRPISSRAIPSKGSAYTLLSDVYLTLGRWQEAYESAKYVIDNKAALGYQLEPDYADLFNDNNFNGLSEHIFAIEFTGNESSYPYNVDAYPAMTGDSNADKPGWSVESPSLKVYETWDNRDYRKKVAMADSIYTGGVLIPYTQFRIPRPLCAKYWRHTGNSQPSGNISDINYAVYRLAEVYLIAAEALNEVDGPTSEALGYVNTVRARARNWNGTMTNFPEDVALGISADDFRNLVLEDRRLELSFEFKRWFDIKRRHLGAEAFGVNGLEPHELFNNDKYLLALPQSELDKNKNLLPQNPGY